MRRSLAAGFHSIEVEGKPCFRHHTPLRQSGENRPMVLYGVTTKDLLDRNSHWHGWLPGVQETRCAATSDL